MFTGFQRKKERGEGTNTMIPLVRRDGRRSTPDQSPVWSKGPVPYPTNKVEGNLFRIFV